MWLAQPSAIIINLNETKSDIIFPVSVCKYVHKVALKEQTSATKSHLTDWLDSPPEAIPKDCLLIYTMIINYLITVV